MPRFVSARDNRYINHVNNELIEKVIETPILFYALSADETKEDMYGEATTKIFKSPVKLNGIINNDEPSTNYDASNSGKEEVQILTVAFLRSMMKEKNIYPQESDIIKWNFGFYEIDHVIENQMIAGKVYYNHSIVCTCHLTSMTAITEGVNF